MILYWNDVEEGLYCRRWLRNLKKCFIARGNDTSNRRRCTYTLFWWWRQVAVQKIEDALCSSGPDDVRDAWNKGIVYLEDDIFDVEGFDVVVDVADDGFGEV